MSKFEMALSASRHSEEYWFERAKLSLAIQLQDLLKATKLTQEKFAEKLHIKPPQVSRALSGNHNPTLETMVKMGLVLGCVPKVTFVPVSQSKMTSESDESSLTLDIEFTKDSKTQNSYLLGRSYSQMIAPKAEWSKSNDDCFSLAA